MLWMIAVILVFLWLLGYVNAYTMGGFIHILPVIAAIALLINIIHYRSNAQPTKHPESE
jgi:Na+-driven multidrug efflux pump